MRVPEATVPQVRDCKPLGYVVRLLVQVHLVDHKRISNGWDSSETAVTGRD